MIYIIINYKLIIVGRVILNVNLIIELIKDFKLIYIKFQRLYNILIILSYLILMKVMKYSINL